MNERVHQPLFVFEGFHLDAQRRVLFSADGKQIPLTPRLFDTLLYFVERAGQLLTKEALLEALWPHVVVEEHNLNKTVSELRRVLGEKPGEHRFIVTKPGRGYRFVADVSIAAAPDIGTNQKREIPSARTAASPWLRSRKLWLVGSIGAVAPLLAAVGFVVPYVWSPSLDRGLHVTPLSFERDGGEVPHVIGSTVWKPDGRAIAFSAYPRTLSGPPQPYVLYLDGSSAVPLTSRFAEGLPKQWTPQGQVVLNRSLGPTLISGHQISQSAGLWTVPAIGGEPEPLFTPPSGTTNILSITPDGSTVAALRRDEQGIWGIWAGSVAGGTLERYGPVPFAPTTFANAPALSFSPDGRQLLLMWNSALEGVEFGEQVWLLPYPPDPERPARPILETLPAYNLTPQFSWLPDNRHIVVSLAELGRPWRLYLADTMSGRFRPLTDGTGTAHQFGPVVSPDGTRFVFSEIATNLDIVTMNVRTAGVSTLIATNRNEWAPAWATDGAGFVYVTDRNGQEEIWLREQDGGDRPLVTQHDFPPGTTAFLVAPQVSPDGSRVMYTRVESDGRGATGARLWMSSLAGGAPIRLGNRTAHENPGSWSPDSAWYVYEELQNDGTFALRKVRTSGTSEPETLATGVRSESVPEWSPDGRWILFDDDGLRLTAADGSETRDLGLKDALCVFARTPEVLYCIDNASGAGERTLVVRSFDGTTRVVGSLGMEHWPVSPVSPGLRLSLTPDGGSVTYSVRSERVQLLLADGLADVSLP